MVEKKTNIIDDGKRKRHSWNKRRYSGKYSSFEIDATCKNCGCFRKKLSYGYEYELNGQTTESAPICNNTFLNRELP